MGDVFAEQAPAGDDGGATQKRNGGEIEWKMKLTTYRGYQINIEEYGQFTASDSATLREAILASDTLAGLRVAIDVHIKAELDMKPLPAIHNSQTGRITSVDTNDQSFWWSSDDGRREKVHCKYNQFYRLTDSNKAILDAVGAQRKIIDTANREIQKLQTQYTDEITYDELRHQPGGETK